MRRHSNKVFLTYGDNKFPKSRRRIINQAQNLNLFTDCIAETPETLKLEEGWKEALKNEEFLTVSQGQRGGGFYMWKPYIIYKNLHKLSDGDLLIYSDAGLTIRGNGHPPDMSVNPVGVERAIAQFGEHFSLLENKDQAWISRIFNSDSLPNSESAWTKMDTFKHFNCLDDPHIINSPQLTSGRHIIKKCAQSLKIARAWWETAQSHPHFFDDSPSTVKNHQDFIENRHDQSVFSIIAKLHGVTRSQHRDFPILRTRIHE
jgi:hypothetical protein